MASKRRILKNMERMVRGQERETEELENSEEFTKKKLDPITAPAVDTMEEMKKRWKFQEISRELTEDEKFTDEEVEYEEELGEEPYPEIEEYIEEDDEEEED